MMSQGGGGNPEALAGDPVKMMQMLLRTKVPDCMAQLAFLLFDQNGNLKLERQEFYDAMRKGQES